MRHLGSNGPRQPSLFDSRTVSLARARELQERPERDEYVREH